MMTIPEESCHYDEQERRRPEAEAVEVFMGWALGLRTRNVVMRGSPVLTANNLVPHFSQARLMKTSPILSR